MSNCSQCHDSLSAKDARWPCCSGCCPLKHLAVGPNYCAENCSLYDADAVVNAQKVRHTRHERIARWHQEKQTQDQIVADIAAANKRAVKRGRDRIAKLRRPYPVMPSIQGACIWFGGRFCGTFFVPRQVVTA